METNRRQVLTSLAGMLTASILPGAEPINAATIFRKVERLVRGRPSPIEFEHLRPGDVMRFSDTPNIFYHVIGDPKPCDPPGNYMIEMGERIELTAELLADERALSCFEIREKILPELNRLMNPALRPPRPGDDTGERS